MSEQQLSPTESESPIIHFSTIITELGQYFQKINLNRIIDGFEAVNIIPSATAQGLRSVEDHDKSDMIVGMLHGKGENVFKIFLKILAAEKADSQFYRATKLFFSGLIRFPGYEQYATWPAKINGKFVPTESDVTPLGNYLRSDKDDRCKCCVSESTWLIISATLPV